MNDMPNIMDVFNGIKTDGTESQRSLSDLMKMAQSLEAMMKDSASGSENMNDQGKINTSIDFDEQLQNPAIKMIKAAIPFMDYKYQKNLGVLVKLAEIQKINEIYSVKRDNGEAKEATKKELLLTLRPYFDTNKQNIIDMFIKMMDFQNIMDVMRRMY